MGMAFAIPIFFIFASGFEECACQAHKL